MIVICSEPYWINSLEADENRMDLFVDSRFYVFFSLPTH